MVLSPSTWLDYSLHRASVSHIFNPHYRPLLTIAALVYLLSAARTFSILFPARGPAGGDSIVSIAETATTQNDQSPTNNNVSFVVASFVSAVMIVAFVYVHLVQGMLVRRNAKDHAKWLTMGLIEGANRLSRNVSAKPLLSVILVSIVAEIGNVTGSTMYTLFVVGLSVVVWRLSVLRSTTTLAAQNSN
jgi:hypothetical protein